MSRRGRGGGRGRGGRFGGSSQTIGGLEISWDPDLALDKPQPSPTFPPYKPVAPKPLTPQEKRQIAHFRTVRKSFHEGPYYTVLGDNVRVSKTGKVAPDKFDPFNGMDTYSKKYVKAQRQLPEMICGPYELNYFPKELHSTLDPTLRPTTNGGPSTKKPKTSTTRRVDAVASKIADEGDEEAESKEPATNLDEDDNVEADDVDDAFDEEDDDDGGDYNAERYFDDGGDDFGEDPDSGDGDGGDYY